MIRSRTGPAVAPGPAIRLAPLVLAVLLAGCESTEWDAIPETAAPVVSAPLQPFLRSVVVGDTSNRPVLLTPGSSAGRAIAAPEIVKGTGSFVDTSAAPLARAEPVFVGSDVTLDFANVDVRDVLKSVLGDLLHVSYAVDPAVQGKMMAEVDAANKASDTVGGIFEVVAHNVITGLGSHAQWDEKLDGRLAQAVMSIQAVKGVEIGAGITAAVSYGSEVMDEIGYDAASKRFTRATNRAGGLEGGITNGEDVVVRGYLKPISTLRSPLSTADMVTKQPITAAYERSDVCVVPAGGVAGEAMVSFVLAQALIEKFGGDSLAETRRNFEGYQKQLKEF